MAELAIKVAHALNLDVAGIDILFDDDGYRICEANSAPRSQGIERACGINVPQLVLLGVCRKFDLPIRHSERWEQAIDNATRAMFAAIKPRHQAGFEPAKIARPAPTLRQPA